MHLLFFLDFHFVSVGKGVPQNHTIAFDYFTRAALLERDGDSLFNAALMHYEGQTSAWLTAAIHVYIILLLSWLD